MLTASLHLFTYKHGEFTLYHEVLLFFVILGFFAVTGK